MCPYEFTYSYRFWMCQLALYVKAAENLLHHTSTSHMPFSLMLFHSATVQTHNFTTNNSTYS